MQQDKDRQKRSTKETSTATKKHKKNPKMMQKLKLITEIQMKRTHTIKAK